MTVGNKKTTNRKGTGKAKELTIATLKTRMNNLCYYHGITLDRSDISKLVEYLPDIDTDMIKTTLGEIDKSKLLNFSYTDKKVYLDSNKYLGYLVSVPSEVEGCTKFNLSFYPVEDGKELMESILDRITYSSGLKISFEEVMSIKKTKDDYSLRLRTTMIKLTSDAWDIKRTIERLYNVTKDTYAVDKNLFLDNRHFMSQETVFNIEAANHLVTKLPISVNKEAVVKTMRDEFVIKGKEFVNGKLIFGLVE
jgi:hypothetical protein